MELLKIQSNKSIKVNIYKLIVLKENKLTISKNLMLHRG